MLAHRTMGRRYGLTLTLTALFFFICLTLIACGPRWAPVIPLTVVTHGWLLMTPPDFSADQPMYMVRNKIKQAELEFPKGWQQIQAFDTAAECENSKGRQLELQYKMIEYSQDEGLKRALANVVLIVFSGRCVPAK